MSLKEKAVKGVIWSAAQSWGSQATQSLTFIVLARLLAPETFGLISLSNIFIHFVQAIIGSGFSDAIVQREKLEKEHLDTAFWVNLGIGVLLTGGGIASAGAIANFFSQPELTPIVCWLSLNVLINSFGGIQQAILTRQLAFRALAARTLVATFTGSVVGIVMAFLGFGVWSLVSQTLVGNLVGVLLLWGVSPWRPGFKVSRRHFQELFSFGINVVGISIIMFFNRRGDDLLIGYFLGPVALGYYSVAYKLFLIITQLLTQSTAKVTLPTFSRLQKEPERLRQAFYKATELMSLVALPAFFGMAVLAPELIKGLFGEQWIQSIPVMRVLALVGIARSVFHFSGPIIMAIGKPAWNLRLIVLNTLANLVGFAIGVRWGILGVAVALVICAYLLLPVRLWVLYKLLRIKLTTYFYTYAFPLVGSLLMAIVVFWVKDLIGNLLDLHVLLAVSVVLGVLSYAVIILLIEPRLFRKIFDLIELVVPIGKIVDRGKTE